MLRTAASRHYVGRYRSRDLLGLLRDQARRGEPVTTITQDQYYLFTIPGDMCPVWAETYLTDGTHVVAPMPHANMAAAEGYLVTRYPHAIVDRLDDPAELAEVRGWARTMPLEQLPVR
jgi:hypothetical protein